MITEELKQKARYFNKMHKQPGMFVIPNAWDAGSAVIFEKSGFKCLATSSAGIAYAFGRPDGEDIAFDELLYMVKKMTARISIPLSVDFERGYSENPAEVKENARQLVEAGAVGFNIEDGLADGTLSPLTEQLAKIEALAELKKNLGIDFVINARTCSYWLNIGSELEKYTEACERGNAFARAGADCVFIPGPVDKETTSRLVKNIAAPLNMILNGKYHDFNGLEAIGVRA